MPPYPVQIPLSIESLTALAKMAAEAWTGLDVVGGSGQLAGIDEFRVMAARSLVVRGFSVDLLPKLEVFTIAAHIVQPPSGDVSRANTPTTRPLLGEAESFLGRMHRLYVAGRRVRVPEWAAEVLSEIVVEDTLVIKDNKDHQLLISADQSRPTTLMVTTDWKQLESPDIELAYLRAIM